MPTEIINLCSFNNDLYENKAVMKNLDVIDQKYQGDL